MKLDNIEIHINSEIVRELKELYHRIEHDVNELKNVLKFKEEFLWQLKNILSLEKKEPVEPLSQEEIDALLSAISTGEVKHDISNKRKKKK